MYHLRREGSPANLVFSISKEFVVPESTFKYLKKFQIDAVRFLFTHFEKNESCILNDQSGLGKTATVAAFLGTILPQATDKKCLIIVNDDERIINWQFHLDILANVNPVILNETTFDKCPEQIIITKGNDLEEYIANLSQLNIGYMVIDNRGDMLANKNFLTMCEVHFKNQIALFISSKDVTIDTNTFYILLQMLGKLETHHAMFEQFKQQFTVENFNPYDVFTMKSDILEEFFIKREMLLDFCREFRLRRYIHQYDDTFPLVNKVEYEKMLKEWKVCPNTQSLSLNDTLGSNNTVLFMPDKEIEEIFRFDDVRNNSEDCENFNGMETDDDMSPLIFECDTDSNTSSALPPNQKIEQQTVDCSIVSTKRPKTPKMIREISNLNSNLTNKVAKPKYSTRNVNIRATRAAVQNQKCKTFEGDLEKIIKKSRKSSRKSGAKAKSKKINQIAEKLENVDVNLQSNPQNVQLSENGQRLSEALISSIEAIDGSVKTPTIIDIRPFSLNKSLLLNSSTDVEFIKSSEDKIISISSSINSITRNNTTQRQNKTNKPKSPNIRKNQTMPSKNSNQIDPSPDLFSTCEDGCIEPSQVNSSLFGGFKIFGSEVNVSNSNYNLRSCLDILEKQQSKEKEQLTSTTIKQTPITGDCDDNNMFEITRNNTFGSFLRLNDNDEVSPLKNKSPSKNKITKYLIGAQNETDAVCPKTPKHLPRTSLTQSKKSPKGNLNNVKLANLTPTSNNLTKWLIKNTEKDADEKVRPTPVSKRRLHLN